MYIVFKISKAALSEDAYPEFSQLTYFCCDINDNLSEKGKHQIVSGQTEEKQCKPEYYFNFLFLFGRHEFI